MNGNNEIIDYEIMNAVGQVIFKGNFIDITTIPTGDFVPGLYLVKFNYGLTTELREIIKD
jgi:hypothetical protein